MSARRRATAAALAWALCGCEGPWLGVPWDFERMRDQARYEAYGESAFFADGMAMRRPPEGTVPYLPVGAAPPSEELAVDRERLELGRERFEIVCAPCHGLDGDAQTPVAAAMALRAPPSLHEPRVRALSQEDLRRRVRDGYGLMPGYAELLDPPQQRAVTLYVQVLQASRSVRLDTLPPALRREAERALGAGSAADGEEP